MVISLFRGIKAKSPFPSHIRNIQQIDDILNSLTGRISRTKSRELSKPAQWIQSVFIDSESQTVEKDKIDRRTLELAFLSILNDIRSTSNLFPIPTSKEMHTQSIEVTFVFDELDKLSFHSDQQQYSSGEIINNKFQLKDTNEYQSEQNRIDNMQRLLSDMKRILSSAPARFIFVGGRALYDQWLADGTKKQPLLSSIFNGQLNLKSLLVHHNNYCDEINMEDKSFHDLSDLTTFHTRIEEYLYIQHYYSKKRFLDWTKKQWVPFFGLHNEPQIEADFSQWVYNMKEGEFHKALNFISCHPTTPVSNLSNFYLDSFVHFLTYRSAGNPKKLKELLASFIHPASRIIKNTEVREKSFPDQDILTLTSLQILRIELISSIYEHLISGFEKQLVTRDDKIVESLFYLTDFLFKFHARAFSWDSLERIDELEHAHRPPDVHRILENLVEHCSEKFLHKVLNGMYSFRFRSDITNEIEYLSRNSAEEMAAFNFTLDESQALKQSYKRALATSENMNADLVAGLGALYEYDQDFEAARHNYRHAIKILDDQLEKIVGSEVNLGGGNHLNVGTIKAILSGKIIGQKNSTFDLSWGGTRLRIMLKIGLTFERSNNYERAILQYRECLNLSNALVDAFLSNNTDILLDAQRAGYPTDNNSDFSEHNQVLKHLNVTFQSIFANAWASEKLIGGIDSSTSIVEKELWDLRVRLPFVKQPDITKSIDYANQNVQIGHAYFSVIISQLHNKAGDLYFFKGAQNKEYKFEGNADEMSNNSGYLLRSHYHYAVSLHEMRRYIVYRKYRSGNKWGKFHRYVEDNNLLISEGCWPDFQSLGVSEGLSDLSESTLALVSVSQLYNNSKLQPPIEFLEFTHDHKKEISSKLIKWFELFDQQDLDLLEINVGKNKFLIRDWFGKWESFTINTTPSSQSNRKTSIDRVINIGEANQIDDRFIMSLYLSIASADLREKAGYLEHAAREYLQICDTISQYFWWFNSLLSLDKNTRPNPKIDHFLHSFSISVWLLEHIDILYRLSRKTHIKTGYIIGKVVPPTALTLACSLSIVIRLIDEKLPVIDERCKKLVDRLTKLIQRWHGQKEEVSSEQDEISFFTKTMENSICIHKYPILNQLNTLKLLIDTSSGLKSDDKDPFDWIEELHELNCRYNAPLHFTPNMAGITYAAFYLKWNNKETIRTLTFDIKTEIVRLFRESREMFTMGRSYYTSIDNLYYLYDDFNDRLIHRNHAMQMAGAELVRKFEKELKINSA